MSYNLTKSQKAFLEWVVQRVRSGELEEDFDVFSSIKGLEISGFEHDDDRPPAFTIGTLEILERAGLLYVETSGSYSYQCSLTERAFEAVGTNFSEPEKEPNHGRLQAFLSGYFKLEELRTICLQLGIDDEHLNSTNKNIFALELVTHAKNRSLLWDLVRAALTID